MSQIAYLYNALKSMYSFYEEKVNVVCVAKEARFGTYYFIIFNGQLCRLHPVTVNCPVNHLVTVKILHLI